MTASSPKQLTIPSSLSDEAQNSKPKLISISIRLDLSWGTRPAAIDLIVSCWILMAFNCLKTGSAKTNQGSFDKTWWMDVGGQWGGEGKAFCCQQNSWKFHLVLTTDPLIGHFWVCVSAAPHPSPVDLPKSTTWLNSTQIWFWFMLPSSPHRIASSFHTFQLSLRPTISPYSYKYNCRLITLASIVVCLSYLHAPYTRIGV